MRRVMMIRAQLRRLPFGLCVGQSLLRAHSGLRQLSATSGHQAKGNPCVWEVDVEREELMSLLDQLKEHSTVHVKHCIPDEHRSTGHVEAVYEVKAVDLRQLLAQEKEYERFAFRWLLRHHHPPQSTTTETPLMGEDLWKGRRVVLMYDGRVPRDTQFLQALQQCGKLVQGWNDPKEELSSTSNKSSKRRH